MIAKKDLAATLVLLGRESEALPLVLAALETSRAQGDRFQECTGSEVLASAHLALGDLDSAERASLDAVALIRAAPLFRARISATRARVLLASGLPAEALEQ